MCFSFFKNISEKLIQLILLGLGVCAVLFSLRAPKYIPTDSNNPALVAPQNLQFFILGYSPIVADSLWIRIIQDFDYCENRPKAVYDPAQFKCEKGWVYRMIDSITEIDPQFRQPYYSGALMLTVVVNDIEGASLIFDKATKRFPTDWEMLFAASYQAMVEENNLAKASYLLDEAGKYGAPAWTRSLAARLQQKSGQLDLAKSILENAVATASDKNSAELFQKRLDEVNAEIAKRQSESAKPAQEQKH